MVLNGSTVEIKVQTDVLDRKALEVTAKINQMERLFEGVQEMIRRTRYYWIGEAGDIHRKAFEDQRDSIEEMIDRLKEYPVDLRKIAGTYVEVENKQIQAIDGMPNDLID